MMRCARVIASHCLLTDVAGMKARRLPLGTKFYLGIYQQDDMAARGILLIFGRAQQHFPRKTALPWCCCQMDDTERAAHCTLTIVQRTATTSQTAWFETEMPRLNRDLATIRGRSREKRKRRRGAATRRLESKSMPRSREALTCSKSSLRCNQVFLRALEMSAKTGVESNFARHG